MFTQNQLNILKEHNFKYNHNYKMFELYDIHQDIFYYIHPNNILEIVYHSPIIQKYIQFNSTKN